MSEVRPVAARSFLYVPGDQETLLARASARHADALILDLEDAVPARRKEVARQLVCSWLADSGTDRMKRWLRINSSSAEADISVLSPAVTGVVVPKAMPGLLRQVDEMLTAREQQLDGPGAGFAILALIETAAGLLAVSEIAHAARVQRLGLGEADLAADLHLTPSDQRDELTSVRLQLVIASAAAGLMPPVGPVSTNFRDAEALRSSTEFLMRLGYRGRTAIHPAQLDVINEIFTPTDAEIAQASQLISAFEAAQQEGSGVLTDPSGLMVDIAVVRSAREVLARAPRDLDAGS